MNAYMGMDEDIAVGIKTNFVTNINTHVVPEQTAHLVLSRLAAHVEFKKTREDSQCNDDNALVKCDQKVHSVVASTEFKKTQEDSQWRAPW